MFSTFTGNSRRPRQVNLSGRNPTTLASAAAAKGQAAALASAQQDRVQRQKERHRQVAAKVLQRVWRGYIVRRKLKGELRNDWDAFESRSDIRREASNENLSSYESEVESYSQVQRLLQYASPGDAGDVQRLLRWFARYQKGIQESHISPTEVYWGSTYLRVQKLVLSILTRHNINSQPALLSEALNVLSYTAENDPQRTSMNSKSYYHSLGLLAASISPIGLPPSTTESLLQSLMVPINALDKNIPQVYENFALEFLIVPALDVRLKGFKGLDFIAEHLNFHTFESALAGYFEDVHKSGSSAIQSTEPRLWLLAYFIYIQRYTRKFGLHEVSSGGEYVSVVSALLSPVAGHYDFDYLPSSLNRYEVQPRQNSTAGIDRFLQDQISSLVDEESIRNLLSGVRALSHTDCQGPQEVDTGHAWRFGRYALNLLQIFPQRRDDIRMWLFLGSSSIQNTHKDNQHRISNLKYYWKATRKTRIFRDIFRDSKETVVTLRNLFMFTQGSVKGNESSSNTYKKSLEDEWSVVMIFLELYSFVLRIMDDDEFFSHPINMASPSFSSISTRNNALPLEDVIDLSTFLKHLGFTMYFNGTEVLNKIENNEQSTGIRKAFTSLASPPASSDVSRVHQAESSIILSVGFSMNYLKKVVTSLLRSIYERDSRRKFTPKDHWLMKSRLEMNGFIPAVVYEEEKSHQLLDDDDDDHREESHSAEREIPIIGAGRIQSTQGIDRIKHHQNRLTRKREAELVTPRLEILQNMPYLISFHTRVQIFREFVHQDQYKRRNGVIDPDMWRWSLIRHPDQRERMEKHQAKIRRNHEFDDAYEQFYQLGDGLKEPIYITFVDQFGSVEAGIDGGGVTKEFLTSVTSQAFEPTKGLNPFITNDKHLLYPNPVAVDEYKEQLRQVGIKEGSQEFGLHIMELLQKYEFLGRIIGKCLYEGILVDLNFAPFFLLKWSLTGGTSSESTYRANLNDLRDLDEALYQGLLRLKNYQGNVEDLTLNFTVTDTITVDYNTGKSINVTQELKPNGSDIPVTNENRLFYVSYVSRYRLQTQPYLQTSAFLKGLSAMIQPSWLAMFNQSELQTLISGTSSAIDLADLRRHTEYGGVYVIGDDRQEHPSVVLFWKVMNSLTDEEQRAVLKFVTSTPRAPLLGFGNLNPRFTIRDAGGDEDRLPSTSTCVNLLKLPRYTKESVLREKLLYSAFSGAGFDLS